MNGAVTRKTLSRQVVDQLRADIITRVFPVGSHITVRSIAERYDTSPIPVREAFNVLSGEKLIRLSPYKGATVCTIDRQFFENIYRILNALELLMIESTMEHWTERLRQEVTEINEQVSELQTMELIWEKYQDLNDQFHEKLEQFSRNDQALELIHQYRAIIRLITREHGVALSSVERLNQSFQEHKAIIEAYEAHDLLACRQAYMVHADNSRVPTMNRIFSEP
jgi:DNA-binding GntR family transcriptional regulator